MKLLIVTLSLIALGVGSPAPKYFLIETGGDILKEDSNVLRESVDVDYGIDYNDYYVSFLIFYLVAKVVNGFRPAVVQEILLLRGVVKGEQKKTWCF